MWQTIKNLALFRWIQRHIIIHPILFAITPVITLIAHNPEINPTLGIRAIVTLAFGVTLCLVLLRRLFPDKRRAAIVSSLFLLLFFSYGHVYYGMVTQSTLGFFSDFSLVGNHIALGLTWILFFIAGLWISKRLKTGLEIVTSAMNIMGFVAILIPLIQISRYELQRIQPFTGNQIITSSLTNREIADSEKPDIYYLILDGYGRADVIEELYFFDNTPFLNYLEDFGFAVAPQSQSNYVLTSLSLASSLNMNYLQDLLKNDTRNADGQQTLARMIRDNAVLEFLQIRGYQTIAFSSGYRPTEFRNADRFFAGPQSAINPIEALLLETSAFALYQTSANAIDLPPYYPGYKNHRDSISYILDALPEVANLPGPKFVFTHIVIPHPPFIFDKHGGSLTPPFRYTLMDGDAFPGTESEYIQGYRDQLTYLNDRLIDIITELVSRSERPTIVIIQGDHGPGMQLNYQSADETNLNERLGILNAFFASDGRSTELGSVSTPVNTFRVLFNQYFQTDFPLLPDHSYYSTLDEPLKFLEVP